MSVRKIVHLRSVRITVIVLSLTVVWIWFRPRLLHRPPSVGESTRSLSRQVRIIRDGYGIAHIYGKTDKAAAFGFAYAHAEDDWPTIQKSLAAARGRLSLLEHSLPAIGNDYYVSMFGIPEQLESQYESRLDDKTRALLEGYAAGLNYYAALHPAEADGRLLPFCGRDIAAGFLHKLPMFMRIHQTIQYLREGEKIDVGERVAGAEFRSPGDEILLGSNAHAVGPARSADGITRLNANSHQPWSGPVAWYEVHIVSDEGWNMTGAGFPGAPVPFIGHNEYLGWSHTVNRSDNVDVYRLLMSDDGLSYRLDGKWKRLSVGQAKIKIDLLLFDLEINLKTYRSDHGPVLKTDHGTYALRYAGIDDNIRSVEQWYRMNKARSFAEWKKAMSVHALPMFNTVYADPQNIYYVYNARLPLRVKGPDWKAVLPGDNSRLIWKRYLPYRQLPVVENPPSGFVQNCNSNPFFTTTGPGNPDPKRYSAEMGLESRMTNRALRSLELFGGDPKITREDFLHYKWDRKYSARAPVYTEAIDHVLKNFRSQNERQRRALELLRSWDGRAEGDSPAAALAVLTWRPIWRAVYIDWRTESLPDPLKTFPQAVDFLYEHYGRPDVPLTELQRLQRGNLDLPLGGGPDVLNAIHGRVEDGRLIGFAGDCYVLFVEFTERGPRSWAIQQYGNSSRKDSPHYADQARAFVKRELRPALRDRGAIEAAATRDYHPGEELQTERR